MSMQTVPIHFRRNRFALSDELRKLQAEEPVSHLVMPSGAEAWLVTGYEDIRQVLSNPTLFGNSDPPLHTASSVADEAPSSTPARHGNLSVYDPPDHGWLRRVIGAGFTPRKVQQLRPRIAEIISDTLSAMEESGPPVDLVQAFALPIPSLIICELLGVPYKDRSAFQQRSAIRFDGTQSPQTRLAAETESLKYMAALVGRKRADPDEALLGSLIREHGAELDDRELIGIGDLLLLGGHETTANMLALGSLFLMENPDLGESVRTGDGVDEIVEEMLRYLSVVQSGVPRIARKDIVLGGKRIRRGDRLLCALATANHDDALTPAPQRFDYVRRAQHLAFGHGIHYCIGAPLARLEMQLAYPALLTRFPGLRPAVEPAQISFRPSSVFYGLRELPVTW